MDRNVAGITYTTYIDPSQVNSSNCDLTEVKERADMKNWYEKSTIKSKGPLGNCRKQCEEISGMFNLTLRK